MVCERCKATVKTELNKMSIPNISVETGVVTIQGKITSLQRNQLSEALLKNGFELIDAEKNTLIEKLKSAIGDLEKYSDEDMKLSFMDYIALSLTDNYISLNTLFSEIEGITIEKYILRHKIERVKEYLVYEDLTLAEIAAKMHYGNVAQLSGQFKRVTGLTPAHFKMLRNARITSPQAN